METYFEAYARRMKNNHQKLMEVSEQLKQNGCKVYSKPFIEGSSDGYRSYILVVKGDKKTYLGFAECPYRWFLDSECSSHKETRYKGFDIPYTLEEIIHSMNTIQNKNRLEEKINRLYVEL